MSFMWIIMPHPRYQVLSLGDSFMVFLAKPLSQLLTPLQCKQTILSAVRIVIARNGLARQNNALALAANMPRQTIYKSWPCVYVCASMWRLSNWELI